MCQLKEHNKPLPLVREGHALKRVIKPSHDLVTSPLKVSSLRSNVTINYADPNPHPTQQSPLEPPQVRRKAGLVWYWEGFLSTRCLVSAIAVNPQIPECQALSHHLAYTGSLESHYPQNQCHYIISILLRRKQNHWQLERTPFLCLYCVRYSRLLCPIPQRAWGCQRQPASMAEAESFT